MQAGRADIRQAIVTAESRLREYLNYSVGRHFVSETLQYPRPQHYGMQFAASIGGEGRWLNIRLPEGYIRNIGVETYSTIDANAAIVYSDPDADGLDDTFTVTVATTLTSADEIGIYFNSTDRLNNEPLSEKYRVSPVTILISGGNAVITGSKWLLVRPIKYQGINTANGLDPDTSSNFATTITVARRYCDPTGTTNDTCQALLVWETEPYPSWAIGACCGSDSVPFSTNSRDPAAYAYGIARAQIRDARLGEITVGRAVYNSTTSEWTGVDWGLCRQPDRVIIRYECGAPLNEVENTLSKSRLDGNWGAIVSRLACAELSSLICACDTANRELWRWQFDLARAAGANDEQYRVSDGDLSNPFGTRAGAVYAWKNVKNLNTTLAFNL